MEDFITANAETIYVSTIHKAKGKEFDNLFILLNRFNADTDENKRQLYVAITRAKNNLHIHYNNKYLQSLSAEQLTYRNNNNHYPEPEHLTLLLGHRDVQLGYFEYVQQRMQGLFSGSQLTITNEGLANAANQLLVKYSTKCKQTLETYFEKGYRVKSASVNCMVYWYSEATTKESKIVLPELYLVKE
jgi:ATP-dependent DNA helicase RecQ